MFVGNKGEHFVALAKRVVDAVKEEQLARQGMELVPDTTMFQSVKIEAKRMALEKAREKVKESKRLKSEKALVSLR